MKPKKEMDYRGEYTSLSSEKKKSSYGQRAWTRQDVKKRWGQEGEPRVSEKLQMGRTQPGNGTHKVEEGWL